MTHPFMIALLVAACGGAPRPAPSPATPDTPAGHQLAWVLEVVAHRGTVDRAALEAHFAPAFLAKLTVDKLATAFPALAAHLAGMTITAVTPSPDGVALHGSAAGTRFVLSISVDASARITKLDVEAELGEQPTSPAQAIAMTRRLADKAQLLVARLDHDSCVPVYELAPHDELALASAFKLYVLLGVADRAIAGALRWDDPIAIRADWKSLPGGITQDDPVGTVLTVRTLAERMISISDNTAADYLLYTVGRHNVEASLRSTGHAKPELDIPFLATRELFWLKTATAPADVDAYLARSASERTALLDGLAGKHPVADFDHWTTPRYIDRIEWFASSDDVCRVVATLRARARDPKAAAALDVLAVNPGLPLDKATWPYIGFKGGSEPGVLNATWLLRRADGAWFVVTLGLNGAKPIDEAAALGVARGMIEMLAAP